MKRKAIIIIIILVFGLLVRVPLASRAQGTLYNNYPNPYAEVKETEATTIINTTFYKIIINKELKEISSLIIKKGSDAGVTVNPQTLPAIIVLLQDNGNVERVSWDNYTVVNYTEDLLKIELTGEALNRHVELSLYLGSYTPYINVKIKISGTPAKVYFVLPIDEKHAGNWKQAIAQYSDETLNVDITGPEMILLTGKLHSAALIGTPENNTIPSLVAGYVEPPEAEAGPDQVGVLDPASLPANPLAGFGNETGLLYSIVFSSRDMISFRLAVAGYEPYALLASGLETVVTAVYSGASNDFKEVIYGREIIAKLNETVVILQDKLNNINKKYKNISKTLEEYKGCESYWKNEIKVREYQIAKLREKVKREGTIAVTVFVIGIILGTIGGYYAIGIEKKTKGLRRRR
ncbi:MAG: hypothetical protein F7C38_03350 [Desulfurococcales archaeon]|nr:hypothetical protein [Desulfurococcales archaeon]